MLPQNETQAYPVAVENIARALDAAFDMSNEAVRKHITAYAKPRTKENKAALRIATSDANEAYQAYRYISRMYDRIWQKYINGTLATDRLDLLAEAEGERMDRESLRLP